MKSILKFLFAVLLLSPAPSFCSAQSNSNVDAEELERKAELCSILKFALANGNAWETGDFLLQVKHSLDTIEDDLSSTKPEDGVLVEGVVLYRVVFDYRKRRVCILSWNSVEQLDMHEPNELAKADILRGFSLDSESQTSWLWRGTKSAVQKRLKKGFDEAAILQTGEFRDFRGFGILADGHFGRLSRWETWVDRFASGEALSAHSESDDRLTLRFATRKDPERGTNYITYEFDLDSNMPVEYRFSFKPLKPKFGYSEFRGEECSVTWQELGDLHVPKFAKLEETKTVQINGREQNGKIFSEYTFHWFSLNEPIGSDEWFDGGVMKDLKTLHSKLDPKICKADTILEQLAKESKSSQRKSDKGR